MDSKEDEHLEFKEAKNSYEFEELVRYCVALANEGGGRMVLGVTNKSPRRIVGSRAFEHLERTKSGLIERLHLRIEIDEILHPDGRVLVIAVPPRPVGMPI
jgi:ATP-dependent DNA helicase RecG